MVTGAQVGVVRALAVDATAQRSATISIVGPTLDPDELAGCKVIALFDRADARDFADVHALAIRHGNDRLLELAAAVDAGFDALVFADMLNCSHGSPTRKSPYRPSRVAGVREFAAKWAAQPRARQNPG
jgi:hypothetical protein